MVEFARPRGPVVELLGEEHQGCPALILADPSKARALGGEVKQVNGFVFMDDEKSIGQYLGRVYGVSRPAHD